MCDNYFHDMSRKLCVISCIGLAMQQEHSPLYFSGGHCAAASLHLLSIRVTQLPFSTALALLLTSSKLFKAPYLPVHIGFPDFKKDSLFQSTFPSSKPPTLSQFHCIATRFGSSQQPLWLRKKTVAPIARRADIGINMMTVRMALCIKEDGS